MKKTVLLILLLLCVASPTLGEGSPERYDLTDQVYIAAPIDNQSYTLSVYEGAVCAYSVEDLLGILPFDNHQPYETEDRGYQIYITNGMDTLTISASEDNGALDFCDIYFSNVKADAYAYLFQKPARHFSGVEASADLQFQSRADAVNQCAALLQQLCPGLTPVCAELWGYTADDLNAVKTWLYENDDMYHSFVDSGKIQAPDTFTVDDEVYSMLFIFEIGGLPVFHCNEVGLTTYSDSEGALAKEMYCNITFNRYGIIEFDLKNCACATTEISSGQTIAALDAAAIAAQRYDDVILSSPAVIVEMYLESMPLIQGDGRIQYAPTWYFRVAPEKDLRRTLEACRIHALTGEVLN